MAGIPAWVYAKLGQYVSIEPYSGVAGDGTERFGTAVTVRAVVEETDATDRAQTPTDDAKTMAVFRCALATDCPAGSRVTLASNRVGIVTQVKRWDGRATSAPSHLEVTISGNYVPS